MMYAICFCLGVLAFDGLMFVMIKLREKQAKDAAYYCGTCKADCPAKECLKMGATRPSASR